MAKKQRRQKKCVKISLNLTAFLKRSQYKSCWKFPNVFEEIYLPVFWYPSLDAALNVMWFIEVLASSKEKKHQTLSNRNSGQETRVITNSDCCKNDPKMPSTCVSNCSSHCPSSTVSFVQDPMPCNLICGDLFTHFKSYGNACRKFLYCATFCIHSTSFHGAK